MTRLIAAILLLSALSSEAQIQLAEAAARAATEVTLRDYLEVQVRWVDRYFEEKIRNMNIAVDKAAVTINTRLEAMNEFRASLNDITGRLATKEEHLKVEERLKLLELARPSLMAKVDIASLEERVKSLELTAAQVQGRATLMSAVWAAAISLVVGIVVRVWKAPTTAKQEMK